MPPLKLTKAAGSLGGEEVDHLTPCDHEPSPSKVQVVPGGGVTCAQVRSTRSSSSSTLGMVLRGSGNTNTAAEGPPLNKSVPARAVARRGEEGVGVVGPA